MFHDNQYKQKFFQANENRKHGLWDQIRVDGGLEFNVICFIQDMFRDFKCNKTRQPGIRTKSTDVSSTYLVLVTWALAQYKLD